MKHYDDEYGSDPYGDGQRWMTGGQLLRLAAIDLVIFGAAVAIGCLAWWSA